MSGAHHNGSSNWPDDRVEVLKKLWIKGLSATQIAKKLGGVTRNAVIGKAGRLGLATRSGKQRQAPAAPSGTRSFGIPAPPAKPRLSLGGNNQVFEAGPARPSPIPPPRVVGAGAGSIGLRIIDTERGLTACKWPITSPPFGFADETRFCCAPRTGEGPYCRAHAAVARSAYQPAGKNPAKALTHSLRRHFA